MSDYPWPPNVWSIPADKVKARLMEAGDIVTVTGWCHPSGELVRYVVEVSRDGGLLLKPLPENDGGEA